MDELLIANLMVSILLAIIEVRKWYLRSACVTSVESE